MVLMLDGLDECEGDYHRHIDFLESFLGKAFDGKRIIKICLSSREIPAMRSRLWPNLRCQIHQFTANDISRYATFMLDKAATRVSAYGLKSDTSKLVIEIVEKAQGVWIWVYLVVGILITDIEEGSDAKELLEEVSRCPPELKDLYVRIIEKIPVAFIHETITYLQLLNIWKRCLYSTSV
jgi:hypothetical protein